MSDDECRYLINRWYECRDNLTDAGDAMADNLRRVRALRDKWRENPDSYDADYTDELTKALGEEET